MRFFEQPQIAPYLTGVSMPEVDSRGFPYRLPETKRPTDSKTGESGIYVGIKGTCVYHSQTERIALHFADFNTRVRAIRTHLPFYDAARFIELYTAGEPIWAHFAATIDIDVVYLSDCGSAFLQHGVSCKATLDDFQKPDVIRRSARETAFYESINGTWECISKDYFHFVEYDNYEYILKHIRRSDVFSLSHDAESVASFWKSQRREKPLNEILGTLAKKLGADEHHAFRLTCAAIYLGYLRIDHRHSFELRAPLRLTADGQYRFRNEPEKAPWGF
ncbi:hypothetical protein [Paraburkholderia bryophila]|uniref:TnsA endonuclease-like protein n=1 Tax=Paraburkholderia bryophila TaxID=420952 RepID=A0A7Y9WRX5_9BURK|nr:hypothetical protein [Paraburkholderia bryophila]NYH26009.1 hypothetical protein [Paraburkholderia bryophila]